MNKGMNLKVFHVMLMKLVNFITKLIETAGTTLTTHLSYINHQEIGGKV